MKVLMVCLGNICRSPLAEGILQKKASDKQMDAVVDSAGTAAYHTGESPDIRSQEVAKKHGIDISGQRARQFQVSDFDEFDRIFAMDQHNFNDITALARTREDLNKVQLIRDMTSPGQRLGVPDPYYGGRDGFQKVYNMLDACCEAILEDI